jgi:hypothetical protein
MTGSQFDGGVDALVRVGGWHADVGCEEIGVVALDGLDQRVVVDGVGDDVEARAGQQVDNARGQQGGVGGDDDACGRGRRERHPMDFVDGNGLGHALQPLGRQRREVEVVTPTDEEPYDFRHEGLARGRDVA